VQLAIVRLTGAILGTCLVAPPAMADSFFSLEIPSAFAVSSMQESAFRPGAMPAIGEYAVLGALAVGIRLRAGALRDGPAPATDSHVVDPAAGGLITGGLAARLALGHGWIEMVTGVGMTGHDVVPAFEGGVGWAFDFDSFSIGPSARYVRLVASSSDNMGNADLVLLGVEVQLGRPHAPRSPRELPPEPPTRWVTPSMPVAQAAAAEAPPRVERDDDRVTDRDLACLDSISSHDVTSGCVAAAGLTVEGDRIILDDAVLFDTERAHVHAEGRALIRTIARSARAHPEWQSLTIEGHSDVRGTDAYNDWLSNVRAANVRDTLIRAGFPADRVTAVGFGRSRPRDPGTTAEANRRNRRVEFVIERSAR
jgi:outer membrane protein OmpA-like peptidoglycan-associated protein